MNDAIELLANIPQGDLDKLTSQRTAWLDLPKEERAAIDAANKADKANG